MQFLKNHFHLHSTDMTDAAGGRWLKKNLTRTFLLWFSDTKLVENWNKGVPCSIYRSALSETGIPGSVSHGQCWHQGAWWNSLKPAKSRQLGGQDTWTALVTGLAQPWLVRRGAQGVLAERDLLSHQHINSPAPSAAQVLFCSILPLGPA